MGPTGLVQALEDGGGVRVHHLTIREIPRSAAPRTLLERHGTGRGAIVTTVRAAVARATAARPPA